MQSVAASARRQRVVLCVVFGLLVVAVYFLARPAERCKMQRLTAWRSAVFATDPACRVMVRMAGRRYAFPAMYVNSAGLWQPQANAYDGFVSLELSGRDFSKPARHLHPSDPAKKIYVIVDTGLNVKNRSREWPPMVVREGEPMRADLLAAAQAAGIDYTLAPGPGSDKFGLVALRADRAGDLYVGRGSAGHAIFFDCSADDPRMFPQCKRTYEADGLSVYYRFPKLYLSDWRSFDQGVSDFLQKYRQKSASPPV